MSELEETLAGQLRLRGVKGIRRQFRFHPVRKWAADFAIPPDLIVEVDGGTWVGGAHSRGAGQNNDFEKQNAAVLMGYVVMRFTTDHVASGYAADTIAEYLKKRRKEA